MGDVVLTTPLIRCLKNQIPGAELHFITKEEYGPLLSANPYLTKVLLLETEITEAVEQLKKENYDLVIDLHDNFRSRQLRLLLQVKTMRYKKQRLKRWLLVVFKINWLHNHIVDRYFSAVRKMNIINDGKGLDYFIPEKDEIPIQNLPFTHIAGYCVIVVGARHFTKRIPKEKLEQLCNDIKIPIILIGGLEDAYLGTQLESIDNLKIYNACGNLSMNQSASVIKKAKFIITPDTGMMHIAAALKKRIISVWGGTHKDLGFTPYLPQANNSVIIENHNLKCRPCHKHGRESCPLGHFKCMLGLDMDKVIQIL